MQRGDADAAGESGKAEGRTLVALIISAGPGSKRQEAPARGHRATVGFFLMKNPSGALSCGA